MDLSPTGAEAGLRSDIRAWLVEHLPWAYGEGLPPRFDDLAEEVAFGRTWQASLAADRWVGVTWPEAYGGRGAGPGERALRHVARLNQRVSLWRVCLRINGLYFCFSRRSGCV